MSKYTQNGGLIGKSNFYWDGNNTGLYTQQTVYDSFSSSPHNREGYNKGAGTTQGLYSFTSFTFTNGPATGRLGPTLAEMQTHYNATAWTQDTNYFNITTRGIQEWTVPETGDYTIRAVGAAGGGDFGGYGADMTGTFSLTQSDVIKIVVGQIGLTESPSHVNGGGGGGSYVVKSPYNQLSHCLVVAGGGGGDDYGIRSATLQSQKNGQTGTSGGNAYGFSASANGGTAGNGGGGINRATGGGGFLTNGGDNTQSATYGLGGRSFVNGSEGGELLYSTGVDGSFGGGGNSMRTGWRGAGGGGGYSGGGAGYHNSSAGNAMGGGGGSVNNGTNKTDTVFNSRTNGFVTITRIA